MERGFGLLQTILQSAHSGPLGEVLWEEPGWFLWQPVAIAWRRGTSGGGGGVAMTTSFEGLPRWEC